MIGSKNRSNDVIIGQITTCILLMCCVYVYVVFYVHMYSVFTNQSHAFEWELTPCYTIDC